MTKILKYDAGIILLKPYVFVMTAVTLLYSYFILSTDIILGVSDTAPFSGWSFGKYMGEANILSILVTLFILATTFSKRQKKVELLTGLTGFPAKKRVLIKSIIIGGFYIFSNLLVLILGCVFMGSLFGKLQLGSYLVSWLLINLPCLFVILGIGNILGKKSPVLIYVFMALIVVMAFAMRESFIDLNGANYFVVMSEKLETINGGEIPFSLSLGFIMRRTVYLILGAMILILNVVGLDKKSRYDG